MISPEKLRAITVYHGTSGAKAKQILREGLTSPSMAYHSPRWFMVAEDFSSAAFHSDPEDPVVVEFRLPFKKRAGRLQWDGYPYLWKGQPIEWGPKNGPKKPTRWFALREPIPPSKIKTVYELSRAVWEEHHVL